MFWLKRCLYFREMFCTCVAGWSPRFSSSFYTFSLSSLDCAFQMDSRLKEYPQFGIEFMHTSIYLNLAWAVDCVVIKRCPAQARGLSRMYSKDYTVIYVVYIYCSFDSIRIEEYDIISKPWDDQRINKILCILCYRYVIFILYIYVNTCILEIINFVTDTSPQIHFCFAQ